MIALSLWGLWGCKEYTLAAKGEAAPQDDGDALPALASQVSLRLDVIPSQLRESDEPDAAYRALPQTVLQDLDPGQGDLELETIVLATPQLQTGFVEAFQLNPSIASLPGEVIGVEGTVRIHAPGTLQSWTVGAVGGDFAAWVVPASAYRLEIVPDDPGLPVYAGDLVVGEVTEDLVVDLGTGAPVYGHVTSAVGPVEGARVHAVDPDGVTSASVVADAAGFYQLRVTPGTWTVVSEGRALGLDPVLTIGPFDVGARGENVDAVYPTGLATAYVEGYVVDDAGDALEGATVRFTATTLNGYDGLDAALSIDLPVSDENTSFIGRVAPGVYTVEVLPPTVDQGADHTPLRVTEVVVDADVNLGTFALEPLVSAVGDVRDAEGKVVPGAQLSCAEIGFDGRYWTVFADDRGTWMADLPGVPLACEVVPPGDRTELATLLTTYDPAVQREQDFALQPGQRITGEIRAADGPEEYAVIEVLDRSGRQLGLAFTDGDGQFEVHVDVADTDASTP